jgi:hypothetical protein
MIFIVINRRSGLKIFSFPYKDILSKESRRDY